MIRFFIIFAVLLASCTSALSYTNVIEGGASQSVTNLYDLGSTNLWVGDQTAGNSMDIISGGAVFNGTTHIGNAITSMNNRITVSSNAFLTSSVDLYVGNEGGGNSLVITNGGVVQGANSYVGFGASATGNTVVVSGTNSTWNNIGNLQVGNTDNSNNSVTVSGSGEVFADSLTVHTGNDFNLGQDGTLGIRNDFNAGQEGFNWTNGGSLLVAGGLSGITELDGNDKFLLLDGGSWDIGTNDLMIGQTGSNNTLDVSSGGTVISANGFIGSDNANSTSNLVFVSGAGSEWRNHGGQLDVSGEGNALSVSSGGRVVIGDVNGDDVAESGIIVASTAGADLSVSNNALVETENGLYIGHAESTSGTVSVVDGGTVIAAGLVIANSNSTFNLNRDGTLQVAGDFDASMDRFSWNDGGRLTIAGGGALEGITALDGTDRVLTLDGGQWNGGESNIWIGAAGSGNTVAVSNGGSITASGSLLVGSATISSTSNSVVIGDQGKVIADNLVVQGTGNHVDLNEGGFLSISGDFEVSSTNGLNWNGGGELAVLGKLTGLDGLEDDGQILQLSGTNALWDLSGQNLNVGTAGSLNRMIINAGAAVSNQNAFVGAGTGTNNSVLVNGTESAWINSGALTIGETSNGNWLDIQGGTVVNSSAYIGKASSASNNAVVVNGTGAEWINNGDLYVGNAGTGNSLFIQNGGVVSNSYAYVGALSGANSNSVIVSGAGSQWINAGDFALGAGGSDNSLLIEGGGYVTNADAFVGIGANADSNSVLVTGSDSEWVFAGTLTVGAINNVGNSVTITNSGHVEVQGLTVADGNNFILAQDGVLSVNGNFNGDQEGFDWRNDSTLIARSNLTGIIDVAGSGKNLVLDGGKLTNVSNEFYVGWVQGNNTVTVSNEGQIVVNRIELGHGINAQDNTLSVSGSKSAVYAENDLFVGFKSSGNKLLIGANGLVTNGTAYVGQEGGSANNNEVTVSGENARWINGLLKVGAATTNISPGGTEEIEVNSGNKVMVSDGGLVQADSLIIEDGNEFTLNDAGTLRMTGDFNLLNPEHAGLTWNSGGNLSVGGQFSGLTNMTDGRVLTIDGIGASWGDAAETNMIVSGGSVMNATNGAITKAGSLAVRGAQSSVNVSSNAWMLVGDGSTTNPLALGGLMVASSNGATLTVSDNAAVYVAETLRIGASSTSTGTVSVSTDGTITAGALVIEDANSAFNLENNGTLEITKGFHASMDGFNWQDGGALSVGGTLSGMSGELDGSDKKLTLSGGSWDEGSGDLTVGHSGSGNMLSIENGGFAANGNGYIGFESTALNNAVIVSGSNSVWNNTGNLYVGYEGSANSLTISDGGTVNNVDGFVGFTTNAMDNTVVVSGNNSIWNNSGTLQIGSANTNGDNSVTVEENGRVVAEVLSIESGNRFNLHNNGTLRMIGDFNVSDFNNTNETKLIWGAGGNLSIAASLSGMPETNLVVAGSTNNYAYLGGGRHLTIEETGDWTVLGATNLIVGFNTDSAELVVSGRVENADGYVGYGSGSDNNTVRVDGSAAEWRNQGNLYVGVDEVGPRNNKLSATNGGWVFVGDASTNDFGANLYGALAVAGSSSNKLEIGSGGEVAVNDLYVGTASKVGTVNVLDEGQVELQNLTISGTNSALNLYGRLIVNSNTAFNGSQGGFVWQSGGKLILNNSDLTNLVGLSGTNKALTFNDGNWSVPASLSWAGSNNDLTFDSSSNGVAVLTASGATISGSDHTFSFSGTNTSWVNNGDLGLGGTNNTIKLTDGATFIDTVNATNNGFGNIISVDGFSSQWDVGENLLLAGTNNTLEVSGLANVSIGGNLNVVGSNTVNFATGGTVDVGGELSLSNALLTGTGTILVNTNGNSMLKISGVNTRIDSGIVFDAGSDLDTNTLEVKGWTLQISSNTAAQFRNFNNLDMTDAALSGVGIIDAFNMVSIDGGIINPVGGALRMPEQFSVSGNPTLQIVAGGGNRLELTNLGGFDLTDLNAEVTIESDQNVRNYNEVIVSSANGLTGMFANYDDYVFDERYLLYNFDFTTNGTEVAVVSKAAANGTISSTVAIAGSEGVRSGFRGMKSAVFTRTKQLRRNVVATANSIPQEAFLLSNTNGPAGAMGPGDQNTIFDMRIWLQHFSGQGDADAYGVSDGYTMNNNGTTIGADRLFGDALTVGVNYTYARSDARSTNNDSVDTETYWLGAYGEWVSVSGLYVDAMLAYGHSDYTSVRVADMYRGTGKYAGNNYGAYADVGQYFNYKNFVLSPYIGLHALTATTDNYIETEEGGSPVRIDETRRSWVESAVGLKARHRFDTRKGRFQTTGYAEWMHDFLQEDIESELSMSGLGPIETARISPDADVLGIGAGFSWICTDYMEIGLGYNGRFSDHYEEHTASAMIDVRF